MSQSSFLPSGNGSSQTKERYTKQRCLGRGSFGMVYLYKDNETNKYVAIKEIFTGDDGFEEVKKEIMNLEELNSPYIVRLIDHLENKQESIYRLVMEYCSGGSLKDKMFNDNELLIIAEHILNGLHYMHSRGFIHRDIKPANLLCCDDEKERVYKLGDLGSSKSMEHSVKTYTGTVTFMAPEIRKLRGIKPKSGQHYDNKVDVWSFGATLLCLGEGSRCKIESNPKFKRIKNKKLRKLIGKCLIIDPKQRSSVAALQKILKSEDKDDEKYEWIHPLMPIEENEAVGLLQHTFVMIGQHIMMIVFNQFPEYDGDMVVCIDLVYESWLEKRKNCVRIQRKNWGFFRNNSAYSLAGFWNGSPLKKSLEEITVWCQEYEKKNLDFHYIKNNSRKFMFQLCEFVGSKCPEISWAESMLYRIVG